MSRFNQWANRADSGQYMRSRRIEGESGVRNFCRFIRESLGYHDPQNFGQFDGACYGDLITFLEDNPGAVQAVVEWIDDNDEDGACWPGDEEDSEE